MHEHIDMICPKLNIFNTTAKKSKQNEQLHLLLKLVLHYHVLKGYELYGLLPAAVYL